MIVKRFPAFKKNEREILVPPGTVFAVVIILMAQGDLAIVQLSESTAMPSQVYQKLAGKNNDKHKKVGRSV